MSAADAPCASDPGAWERWQPGQPLWADHPAQFSLLKAAMKLIEKGRRRGRGRLTGTQKEPVELLMGKLEPGGAVAFATIDELADEADISRPTAAAGLDFYRQAGIIDMEVRYDPQSEPGAPRRIKSAWRFNLGAAMTLLLKAGCCLRAQIEAAGFKFRRWTDGLRQLWRRTVARQPIEIGLNVNMLANLSNSNESILLESLTREPVYRKQPRKVPLEEGKGQEAAPQPVLKPADAAIRAMIAAARAQTAEGGELAAFRARMTEPIGATTG